MPHLRAEGLARGRSEAGEGQAPRAGHHASRILAGAASLRLGTGPTIQEA
jgi:hypothetical protein